MQFDPIAAAVMIACALGVATIVALVCLAVSMHRESAETVPPARGATPDHSLRAQWVKGYRFARNVADSPGLQGCKLTANYADHLARTAPSDHWRTRAEALAVELREKVAV